VTTRPSASPVLPNGAQSGSRALETEASPSSGENAPVGTPAFVAERSGAANEQVVVQAVRRWIDRAVIGLGLCPFAGEPVRSGRLRVVVSQARDDDALLRDLEAELMHLRDTPVEVLETTLIVHPEVLGDFDQFSNFLPVADLAVRMLRLEGTLQVASFHPDFRFAESGADDIENFTNRAPYPCLHLLREDSIEAAVAGLPDPDAIYRRNLETLRRLGHAGWEALWVSGGD